LCEIVIVLVVTDMANKLLSLLTLLKKLHCTLYAFRFFNTAPLEVDDSQFLLRFSDLRVICQRDQCVSLPLCFYVLVMLHPLNKT